MKKSLTVLLLTFVMNLTFGQTEKATYKTVVDSFEKNYNADNFEAIFSAFSSELQSALPLDKAKDFLTGLKSQAGKITKREFVKYEQTYASYKTNFERALFAVNISIDNNSKINGLFVKPFKESDLPKIERNTTKLKLPFKDEWTVVWGGDTKEQNYHVENFFKGKYFFVQLRVYIVTIAYCLTSVTTQSTFSIFVHTILYES